MAWTFDNSTKLAIRGYANAPATAATEIRTQIGSGWIARVYTVSGDTQIATGTAAGSLGGTGANITGSVNVTFSATCNPATASYYAMIRKSDGTRWLRGTVGLAGSGADVIISKAAANTDVFALSISLNVPTAIDPAGQFVVAINCGGNAYTDAAGIDYLADIHFSGGTAATVTDPIAGTTDDPLYQTERWGAYTYSIPVTANKTYRVTLKFCEIFNEITAAGQRVFDVELEPGTAQEVVIADVDIYAAAGALVAYDVTRDVTTTDGNLVIELVTGTQNPKLNAILIYSPDGGVYVPPTTGGGGTEGRGNLAWIKRFKTDPHDANFGLMWPWLIDWATTGRDYATNYLSTSPTDPNVVPWGVIGAAGTKIWPQTCGVEIGLSRLWGRKTSDGLWTGTPIFSWPTYTTAAHNRDNYGFEDEPRVGENVGTLDMAECERTTNAGTKVVRRGNNARFPESGTHIHPFFEGNNSTPSATGRVGVTRSSYHELMWEVQMRVVGWPSSNGLAPITNPADYDGTSIVALVSVDSYSAATGSYEETYRGDLGICRAAYVTTAWQSFYWFSCLASDLDTDSPPWV